MLVASFKENDIGLPGEVRSLMDVIFGLSLKVFFLVLYETNIFCFSDVTDLASGFILNLMKVTYNIL